jgi:hypothetical protein
LCCGGQGTDPLHRQSIGGWLFYVQVWNFS